MLVILAVVNTPAFLVGMAFVCIKVALDEKRWKHLLPLVVAAAAVLAESWISRGHPLVTGYEGDGLGPAVIRPYGGKPGFSFPLFFGILSILFSFGRGILFYVPGLWLALHPPQSPKTLGRVYVLWMLLLVGEILIYSRWHAWHGAGYWGPRFFLFASIPSSYLLAVRLSDVAKSVSGKLITLIVLSASAWVGLDGGIFHLKNLPDQFCDQLEGILCLYVPEFSPLWFPFVKSPPMATSDWAVLIYSALVFVTLAAPLAWKLASDARQLWNDARGRWSSGWRF